MFVPPPRAVLVDAGFTLLTYDGTRIAALAGELGVEVSADAVSATESAVRAELGAYQWPQRPTSLSPKTGGARLFHRILELAGAGVEGGDLGPVAHHLWAVHLGENLWSRPFDGVAEALESLRCAGLHLAVISNSEGNLEALLRDVDLAKYFDVVIDSWHLGITKPEPAIFDEALRRLGVAPADALMVGDSLQADVEGALAAGIPAALVDPFDLHPQAAVPRFRGFPAFAHAVLASLR